MAQLCRANVAVAILALGTGKGFEREAGTWSSPGAVGGGQVTGVGLPGGGDAVALAVLWSS